MSMPTWLALSQSWDQQREKAAEAKIREEEMARKRLDWANQDKQNAVIDAEREAAVTAVSRPFADGNSAGGYKAALGLDVPQSAAAMRRGDERFQYGQADVATPEAPGAQPQFALDQQANTLSALNMAGRNPQAIMAARDADTKNRLSADAARIASYAQSADATELKDLMGKVTLDKRNKYETEFNPATGITRIKQGDTSVDLSRADLGKFLAAQYRLKNGDASASADIEAIDGKLAKVVSESLQIASTLAKSGNDATHTEGQMRNDNLRTGSTLANASMAREDRKLDRIDRDLMRTAGVDYERARQTGDDAGMKAATLKIIQAGGTNPGAPSANEPAEVKLARSALQSNVPGVTDMASALEWAKTKNGMSQAEVRRDIYGKALTANFGNAANAQRATDESMKYLFPPAAKPAGGPAGGPAKGAVVNGFKFNGGNPNDKANWTPVAR